VAYSPDGRLLASRSTDKTARSSDLALIPTGGNRLTNRRVKSRGDTASHRFCPRAGLWAAHRNCLPGIIRDIAGEFPWAVASPEPGEARVLCEGAIPGTRLLNRIRQQYQKCGRANPRGALQRRWACSAGFSRSSTDRQGIVRTATSCERKTSNPEGCRSTSSEWVPATVTRRGPRLLDTDSAPDLPDC